MSFLAFFAFLVCTFHKEPIENTDFDRLYLKSYFEFFNRLTISDSSDITLIAHIRSTCKNQGEPSYALNIVYKTKVLLISFIIFYFKANICWIL